VAEAGGVVLGDRFIDVVQAVDILGPELDVVLIWVDVMLDDPVAVVIEELRVCTHLLIGTASE
jgi:hypothetical protein